MYYMLKKLELRVIKKINLEIAKQIRWDYKSKKLSQNNLSKIYGITSSNIGKVLNNERYYDENYTPKIKKYKNSYSDEFLQNLKDFYYIYGMGIVEISKMFNLNKSFVKSSILRYNKYLI